MNIFIPIVMWTATAITGIMFIPQAYKTFKTKTVGDLSIISYSIVLVGTSLWVIWGGMGTSKGPEWGALAANAAILVVTAPIVWYLYKPKHKMLPIILYVLFGAIIAGSIAMACIRTPMNQFMLDNSVAGTVVSIVGGCGTGFAFFPQTYKQVKSKSFKGVSMLTTGMIIACNYLWVTYYLFSTLYATEVIGTPEEVMSVSSALLAFLPPIFFSAISGSIQVLVLVVFTKTKKKSKK